MKVINFFGTPGSGKSTTAAGLFHVMKNMGLKVELVTEYAKDMVWDENYNVLKNQVLITAKQYNKINRLVDKVDYVITDSPILLGIIYNTDDFISQEFNFLCSKLFNKFDNFNIYLNRRKKYQQIGRLQTEEESDMLGKEIKKLLLAYDVYFPDNIVDVICLVKDRVIGGDK